MRRRSLNRSNAVSGQLLGHPVPHVLAFVDALAEQQRRDLPRRPEAIEEVPVSERAVVDLLHELEQLGWLDVRGDERSDDRARGRARDPLEAVAPVRQDRDGADERNALDATALEHDVGHESATGCFTHRSPHF